MIPGKTRNILLSVLLGFWSICAIAGDLNLNASEQDFLKKNTELSLCVDPDWLPYEKINAQGQHIGLVSHYMFLLETRLDITFKLVKTKNWGETQTLYREGQCDIVSALNKTSQREQYLNFTQPYIKSPAVLILNEANEQYKQLSDLKGKTLGMVKGYVYDLKLREQYPDIKIDYFPNMTIALQKVSSGEIDATLGPLFLAFALTQNLKLTNLKIMGNTRYQDELRIGTRKDNKILASIFEKAVLSITADDNAMVRKVWAEQR